MDLFELVYLAAFFLGTAFAYVTVFVNPRGASGRRLNPMRLSLFLAAWGACGIVLHKWLEWSFWLHFPGGLLLGALISAAAYWLMPKQKS